MLVLLRYLLAILLLPVIVVVAVPYWLTHALAAVDTRWRAASPVMWLALLAGGLCFLASFLLFAWCVALFARIGRGTLAPWDPTRTLVAVGPYAFVRNPMISGVVGMLTGEALIRGSWVLGIYTCLAIAINHVYFIGSEEPGLEKRFGEAYRQYKASVPRWIPRFRSQPNK